MMKVISVFHRKGLEAIEKGLKTSNIFNLPVREKIGRLKYVKEEDVQKAYDSIEFELDEQLNKALEDWRMEHA